MDLQMDLQMIKNKNEYTDIIQFVYIYYMYSIIINIILNESDFKNYIYLYYFYTIYSNYLL